MNHETNSATATAPAVIDVEPENETTLERRPAELSVAFDVSPEALSAQIERESAKQKLITQYVRDHMVKDHHYYSFNEGGKPALTKDGAYRICSLFKVVPGPSDVEIIREDGGHFTVRTVARLLNADGVEIASAMGSASTRESKYAYRWVNEKQLPADVDKAKLKSRSGSGQYGKYTQYQLPNPDLADLENTIIKMSDKRATVGAVNKLPLVSELFADDPDDKTPERHGKSVQRKASRPAVEPDEGVRAPEPAAGSIETAVNLATKLQKDHGVKADDLAAQFLPDGVTKFSELSDEQAAAVVPGLAELLTAKVNSR